MPCPRCRQENPAGSNFCLGCGSRLALTCASCGAELLPASKFCNKCGAAVPMQADGPPGSASPRHHTPKHLAEKILSSKSSLEGERKQVTVLFADLKGSMELLAARDPEEARTLLDPVIERMMEAVHHYEGLVNQVMGDGIMALFGAPLAHEDHAIRACYAALRMQESAKRYAEEVQRSHGVPLSIRVGLHSGEVVVRSIGSDLDMDYTAVGQTTHLAARLEQAAQPGSTLLTATTLALAEGYVAVKPVGPIRIKGLSEPVDVYDLIGTGAARTRLQARAGRGLTRFIGRDAEMDALRRALEQAGEARGQVVAVVGEPGVGKSRLLWEIRHSHRLHGWLVLESASASYGKASAYLPVIDLLRSYFQIEGRDDTRRTREKVTGKLLTLDPSLGATVPALLALLGVAVDDPAWEALDPPQRRQQTLDAVKRLLLRESQIQPLLVAFEDLHWIDGESQALLDGLVESLPAARVLLFVNYRPEYQHRWSSRTYYTQLRLDPLPSASAAELLDTLLGADATLPPLKRFLIERTEGNPFFLEECVQALAETTALAGERGAYRLTRSIETLEVPATVQVILAARIDRLHPDDKSLLQVASVIGESVPLSLLHAVAALSEDGLRTALGHLQGAEFLYEASLFPEAEYAFKHGLTCQVAYGSLLQDRRRHLHARVADAIERMAGERTGEHAERLAYHAFKGELWDRAVTYLRQAGARALAASASREAAAAFEQALVALERIPRSPATIEQAIDLRFELRAALQTLGEHDRVLDHLREAERLAATLEDERRRGWVSAYLSQYSIWMGDYEAAAEAGQRALTIGAAAADLGLQVAANCFLAQLLFVRGDFRRAIECCRWTAGSIPDDRVRERFGLSGSPAMLSRSFLVMSAVALGEFTVAVAWAEESLRIAESIGQPYSLNTACFAMAEPHLARGDVGPAVAPLERALERCETWNLAFLFPITAVRLGMAYARSGRLNEALPLLEAALARVPQPWKGSHGPYQTALVEARLLAGQLDAADDLGQRALTLARQCGSRGFEARLLWLLGRIAAHREHPNTAASEARHREALALATELGMRPLVAHCHLGLGTLYRRTGKREEAHAHLTTATTMYREMGMHVWLEQVQAEARGL
ncbi:MAG: AAA family ATPase [Candidatus Rokuibacteriota bacterium]